MGFIDLDINEVINGDGYRQLQNGSSYKTISLNPPQMDMFTELIVTKNVGGVIWLDFLSESFTPNVDLMDFMKYCEELWGVDLGGRGGPSEADAQALKEGTFGRDWENVKLAQVKKKHALLPSITLRIILNNNDMSSFINNLAKGFVRSAVNQVGRDGGRVISNSIYNGRNYVPVSEVGEAHNTAYGSSSDGIPENAISKTKPFSFVKILLLTLASIMFSLIGSVCVFLYGVSQFISTKEKVQWEEKVRHYARDRRYKSGSRYLGSQIVMRSAKVDASPEAIAINKRNGIVAMAIGGVITILTAMIIWGN